MTAKPMPMWTIICDACGQDLGERGEYAAYGPTESDARQYMLLDSDGVSLCGVDICEGCQETSVCASCGEEDHGFFGNCFGCWEWVDRSCIGCREKVDRS